MSITELRQILHNYINTATEEQLLTINAFVNEEGMLDEATLKILHERAAEVLQGNATTYTVEESMSFIRANKKPLP